MFLKHIDLTSALRPSYLPDEVLLFVQDNVGLYEGKFKLPNQQNGQVYLTSHRICYVDKNEPRSNSLALDLRDAGRYEFYAGFLKSSAKITIFPKHPKRSTVQNLAVPNGGSTRSGASSPGSTPADAGYQPAQSPISTATATWICTICSFANPIPSNFDATAANAHTPLPPCQACGIKPTLAHILKAAIANASNRHSSPTDSRSHASRDGFQNDNLSRWSPAASNALPGPSDTGTFSCPRCTFSNHPSLLSCEICGASLTAENASTPARIALESARTDSPGPISADAERTPKGDMLEGIKLSFRSGGEKIFYERLKGSMTQRKWVLQNAPPAPRANRLQHDNSAGDAASDLFSGRAKTAGIAGLEQLGVNMRKNNEMLIGSAFEDLEALMSSAKEVIALAENFARQTQGGNGSISAEENAILAESATQLGLVTTKDIVGGGGSESLYLSELSRNLAEFLTDDTRGVLKKAGGILTLVDLWAMFNRARGGVELVSPMDFEKAAALWESLKLPVRLRTFRSGVMVVQGHDRTDEATVRTLVSWLQDLHEFPPEQEVLWEWHRFGNGVTAQDAAERFGWSIGVAEEELLMAEERGSLCREEGLEGLKFWVNYIDTGDIPPARDPAEIEAEACLQRMKDTGLL